MGRLVGGSITHIPAAHRESGIRCRWAHRWAPTFFLTSSEIPVGTWRHWHVDGAGRPDEMTIAHSSLYDDPRVIAEVLAWIRARTG